MRDILIKWFTGLNAFLIRISRGRIGGQLGTQSILILQTTGRKSGRLHSIPVAYFKQGEDYLLVGSNWGRPNDADWVRNLRRDPQARIAVRGRAFAARAREADGEEYSRLWKYVTQKHPPYIRYHKMAARRIPILILDEIH